APDIREEQSDSSADAATMAARTGRAGWRKTPRSRPSAPLNILYVVAEESLKQTCELPRVQLSRRARIPSLMEPIVAMTADSSYTHCPMQCTLRGSLPRPYFSHSVVSISSLYVVTYPSDIR